MLLLLFAFDKSKVATSSQDVFLLDTSGGGVHEFEGRIIIGGEMFFNEDNS